MEDEITTAEAAEILGVGQRHVNWYYTEGLLPGRRIGKRVLVFRRADVEAFVKPNRKPGPKSGEAKTGRPSKAKKGSGKP